MKLYKLIPVRKSINILTKLKNYKNRIRIQVKISSDPQFCIKFKKFTNMYQYSTDLKSITLKRHL
jgi:hypothetical protein